MKKGFIEDVYKTTSGKVVKLGIFSDKENVGKLDHAMYSLKESMKWDEKTFGLECDLDVYNIVGNEDSQSVAFLCFFYFSIVILFLSPYKRRTISIWGLWKIKA